MVIIFENNNLHHGPENSKKGLQYRNGNTYHSLETNRIESLAIVLENSNIHHNLDSSKKEYLFLMFKLSRNSSK